MTTSDFNYAYPLGENHSFSDIVSKAKAFQERFDLSVDADLTEAPGDANDKASRIVMHDYIHHCIGHGPDELGESCVSYVEWYINCARLEKTVNKLDWFIEDRPICDWSEDDLFASLADFIRSNPTLLEIYNA